MKVRIKNGPVATVCYGEVRRWDTRAEALDFFGEGASVCDGHEAERYTSVYLMLLENGPYGWDGCEIPAGWEGKLGPLA